MTLACRRIIPRLSLADDQFVMIITASRISRITDYGCKQTAGLFGDMATATLIAPSRSRKYPVHFDVLYADAQKQPADRPFFDFHLRQNVPLPEANGGIGHATERLVFSLDGMGIADIAPRAMSSAVDLAVRAAEIPTEDVRFVVPHQAGSGIVRFTGMKLESLGIRGELINGLTQNVGNISSSSVPYALKKTWQRLSGIVACPTAAVGSPGAAEVSQGCILLKATPLHEHSKQAAA